MIDTGGLYSERVWMIQTRSFRSTGGGALRKPIYVCQYASTVPTSTQ
jgi:hypothetical protein